MGKGKRGEDKNFKNAKSFRAIADDGTHYLITYDYAAGKRDRYTTLQWSSVTQVAKVIGRECPLGVSKKLCRKINKGKNKLRFRRV